jgi:hypothetical protein
VVLNVYRCVSQCPIALIPSESTFLSIIIIVCPVNNYYSASTAVLFLNTSFGGETIFS